MKTGILEKYIHYLKKEKLIPIGSIIEKLEIDRHTFNNIRRSNNDSKKEELANKLKDTYVSFLGEVKEHLNISPNPYQDKYLRLLEEHVELLRQENMTLRKSLFERVEELERRIKELGK